MSDTMKLFGDDSDWEAREMVAPSGQRYTPGSAAEERELKTAGYRTIRAITAFDDTSKTAAVNASKAEEPEKAEKVTAKVSKSEDAATHSGSAAKAK